MGWKTGRNSGKSEEIPYIKALMPDRRIVRTSGKTGKIILRTV